MKTMEYEVHKGLPKVKVPLFKDLPIVGDQKAIASLKYAVSALSCNWEGHVEKVISVKDLEKLHIDWFQPSDKGGLSLFGVDSSGTIIFGMALYVGYKDAKNPLEQKLHYYIQSVNCTNCWAN